MIPSIKINDFVIDRTAGSPFTFYGALSEKTLPGIDLKFSVSGPSDIEAIEAIFSQEVVQVDDPFVGQSYQASIQLRTSSYVSGNITRHYIGQVQALDVAPEFSILEIEGDQFPVLATHESIIDEEERNGIVRDILLRLTPEQFLVVQGYLRNATLSVRRVGVDEQPILARQRSFAYWSQHVNDGVSFYKQIVPLIYPADILPSRGPSLALRTDQDILSGMLQTLVIRFERLLDELVESNAITTEKRKLLLSDNLQDLLDSDHIDRINQQRWRVADAEAEL
jgi:hypothetical protein